MAPLGDDVFFLSVAELSRKIRAKEVSTVALTEGYLDRLERLGPKFGAVVTIHATARSPRRRRRRESSRPENGAARSTECPTA